MMDNMNKDLQTPLSFLHLQGQPKETWGEGTNCPWKSKYGKDIEKDKNSVTSHMS